ncbi:MAG: hypothetical protein LBH28_05990, partial [Oscillospiraceae bacterium]|nr:hypothetical protein [Oscillospiraceae bacterium]
MNRRPKYKKLRLIAAFLLLTLMMAGVLSGCSSDGDESNAAEAGVSEPANYTDGDRGNTDGGGYYSSGGDGGGGIGNTNGLAVKPDDREVGFKQIEQGFYCDNGLIKMIEINQALSYGYNSDSGLAYTIENFVAGKETAIFVDVAEALWGQCEFATLSITRNGEFLAELLPAEIMDDNSVLYQPKNMADVGNWEAGAYVFTFDSDGVSAQRTANFYETMQMKVLAVPVLANYSGNVVGCEGEWRSGATMLYATYPLARANMDFVLSSELDLSDAMYDLNDSEGQYKVWEALSNLQTPDKAYTIIIGFIRDGPDNGRLCGYTYGLPANIVVESDSDMLSTVVHEVAHCYNIGDEYEGGSINNNTNPPPYGMEGTDINSDQPTAGNKEKIIGGVGFGISGTGSVIYENQRAYWVEGRRQLGAVTSYMGGGTGADSFTMWTTADIWNHLFYCFTGMRGAASSGGGSGESGGSSGGSSGGGNGGSSEAAGTDRFGQCPECYGDVIEPDFCTECSECGEWTLIDDYDYICEECGGQGQVEDEYYILCDNCGMLISFSSFSTHNSGYGKANATYKEAAAVQAI